MGATVRASALASLHAILGVWRGQARRRLAGGAPGNSRRGWSRGPVPAAGEAPFGYSHHTRQSWTGVPARQAFAGDAARRIAHLAPALALWNARAAADGAFVTHGR